MVINMNEARLTTLAQIEVFLNASACVEFKPGADVSERYAHISAVLKRFDYLRCKWRDRGVLLTYLRRTSGYKPRPDDTAVLRWQENRLATTPLIKGLRAPAAPFTRKYTPGDVALLKQAPLLVCFSRLTLHVHHVADLGQVPRLQPLRWWVRGAAGPGAAPPTRLPTGASSP
jgi:hypothetical protein